MGKYTREQLTYAAKEATERGDSQMARAMARKLMAMDAHDAEVQRTVEEYSSTDEGVVKNLAIAGGRGMTNIGRAAQDGIFRITGNDDALARLNAKDDREQLAYDRFDEENPIASGVGQFIGETAATSLIAAPARALMVGGKLQKAMSIKKRMALAAGEGAATGVIATKGDLEDRLKGGVIEAGLGSTMEGTAGAIGRRLSLRKARKSYVKEGLADEQAYIDAKMDEAARVGGYQMDAADASGRSSALDARNRSRASEDPSQLQFEADAEADIIDAARGYADGTGGVHRTDNEIAEELGAVLADERAADMKGVDEAYDSWRASHGSDVMLDTTGFMGVMDSMLGKVRQGQKSLVPEIKEIMAKHKVDRNSPISVDQVEEVIQDINSLYKPNDDKYNGVAGKIKEAIDDWATEGFGDLTDLPENSPIRLGQEARRTARAAFKKWDTGDIVDKITSFSRGTKNLRTNPIEAVKAFNQKKNLKELRKLKLRLQSSEDPRAKQLWADMAAAPLFDALDKALPAVSGGKVGEGGQQLFGTAAFFNAIKNQRLAPETKKLLWGNKADSIEKAMVSWNERGKIIQTRGDPGKSGTAAATKALSQAGVRASNGQTLTVLPVIGWMFETANKRAAVKGGRALRSGKLDKGSIRELTAELKNDFAANHSEAFQKRYGQTFGYVMRQLAAQLGNDRNPEGDE